MIKSLILVLGSLLSSSALSLSTGEVPKIIELKGDEGGRTDDSPWSSAMLTGKVHMLFYVDPDEKGINKELEDRLAAEKFDREKFTSVAVINQKATWLPNVAIDSSLASKQKEFPNTVYVRDKVSKLVKEWNFKDDAYVISIFNKEGNLIFIADGALNKNQIEEVIMLIKSNL